MSLPPTPITSPPSVTPKSVNVPQLVLNITGAWGRWQLHFFGFFMITAICSCWHSLQLTFIAPNVKFWCIDDGNSAATSLSFFSNENSTSSTPTPSQEDQCKNTQGAPCQRWAFDVGQPDSFYHRTIVSEWSLVCDSKWLASFTQSAYMIGTLAAVFLMSHCSDRIGRRPTIIVGWFLQLGGCLSCAFSASIVQFLASRLVLAFGMGTTWSTGFVLLLEIVGPQHREVVGLAVQLGWAAGYLSLPGLAYLTRDFRHLLYCCAGLQSVQAVLYWALPESPRWLLASGRLDAAQTLLTQIAKLNRTATSNPGSAAAVASLEKDFATLRELAAIKNKERGLLTNSSTDSTTSSTTASTTTSAPKKYSILDLFSSWRLARVTSMIYFIWFANSLTYYGLSLNTNDFVGDPFVNFFLLGAVEVPAYLACMYVVKRFGHKKTLLVTMVGAGLGCLAAISINYNYYTGIVFAMAGKFCVTASFAIIYVYSTQIYPTVMRTIGLGTSSMVARIGSVLAPFIKDLSNATTLAVPMVLLGALSISAGCLIMFLREPRGVEMPDTPEEMVEEEEKMKEQTE